MPFGGDFIHDMGRRAARSSAPRTVAEYLGDSGGAIE